VSADIAKAHGLQEQAFWSITSLQLRCMLYKLPRGADRTALLQQLARDPRVQLAQPLNDFHTLAEPEASAEPRYDDPYVGLQRGFAAVNAAQAQRWTRGDGVRVALIDTGVDIGHPDLEGRIAGQRNFVAADRPPAAGGEQHGTEMAGVIAAAANNRIGIVGMAPQAQLLAYRACWPVVGGSRCNSFTLAQALGAAIAAGSDVINLSLGGPPDPLLQKLTEYAIQRGSIVVGAMLPGGGAQGFPAGVPGVLAVASSDDAPGGQRNLAAPGKEILTLTPGGHYGYASGSSLAAAHVSGAVALLRSLDPSLRADTAQAWLLQSAAPDSSIDICSALRHLRPAADCSKPRSQRATLGRE
jgi:subtilisin family serine protease